MELTISRGKSAVGVAKFGDHCRLVTIGTDPKADVTVVDGAVSAFHTRLTRRGALWWLHDLNSPAGTQINGRRVTKGCLLQHGDVFTCGDHALQVSLGDALREAAAKLRGVSDPSEAPASQAHLRLKTGGALALDRDSFLIGKDEGADLRLRGWSAPGQLAVIVRAQGGHYLINLTGADVLHEAKPMELRVQLKDGDRIELRDVYATFHQGACPS